MTGKNYKRKAKKRKRSTKKTEILGIKIPIYMLPLLIMFGIATVWMTIEAATSGAKLAELERQTIEISKENQRLSAEIIKNSSLKDLEDRAEELDFVEPEQVVYISEEEAVAKLP